MPRPNAPDVPEFYVYRFEVGEVPFYVGIGRSARASDRVRYVRYMMDRERQGKPVHWHLSSSTIALALQLGQEPQLRYVHEGLCRADALEREREEIALLLREGNLLANIHHNPGRPASAAELWDAIMTQSAKSSK